MNVKTPCLTFDLPLWLKAMDIIKAESFDMILILGGFHTMMSFVGSIGNLMDGSGSDSDGDSDGSMCSKFSFADRGAFSGDRVPLVIESSSFIFSRTS